MNINRMYEKYMFLVGIGGSLVFYLQAFKIFYYGSAKDISLTAFLVGLVSVLSWMIYGLIIRNRVLVVANVVATIGALLVVTGIMIYS